METHFYIMADLKAAYQEGHRDFSFLTVYKGVPLVCRARLDRFENEAAIFTVQPPEIVILQVDTTTLVLSDGLLEPLEAEIACLDLASGEFALRKFIYAGSKFANRRELRVQPDEGTNVQIARDSRSLQGTIDDLSVRGLGVRLPIQDLTTLFSQGQMVAITLNLPQGEVRLEGKVRDIARFPKYLRLAVEYIGAVPEKAKIINYVMKRRSEIVAEVRKKYEEAIRGLD